MFDKKNDEVSFCAEGHLLKETPFIEKNENVVLKQHKLKYSPNTSFAKKDTKRDFDKSFIEANFGNEYLPYYEGSVEKSNHFLTYQ